MSARRTFVDSSVLIAAVRGDDKVGRAARSLLNDAEKVPLSSGFVRLEVVPQALRNRRASELAFYEAFFERVMQWWSPSLDVAISRGIQEAQAAGLAAVDALHVAAARDLGADEFITAERPERAICRVDGLNVVSIHRT